MTRHSERGQNRTLHIILLAIAMAVSGCGEPTPKVHRVGIVSGLDYILPVTDGLKAELAELGYVEGENIRFELERSNIEPDLEKQTLQRFSDERVDVILAYPTEVAILAKNNTQASQVPVVFAVSNIEHMGLVDSIAQPGGNVTGVRYPGPDIAAKRYEIMRELAPETKTVMLPYQKGADVVRPQLELMNEIAPIDGIQLIEMPANSPADLADRLGKLAPETVGEIDFVLFLAEPLTVVPETVAVLGQFGRENQIPMGGTQVVIDGYRSVFGVNIDFVATGRQAAVIVDKILKGDTPATIPVVSSETVTSVDLKAAREFGLAVPEGLLNRMDIIVRE